MQNSGVSSQRAEDCHSAFRPGKEIDVLRGDNFVNHQFEFEKTLTFVTPSGATFSTLLRPRRFGASRMGEAFCRRP